MCHNLYPSKGKVQLNMLKIYGVDMVSKNLSTFILFHVYEPFIYAGTSETTSFTLQYLLHLMKLFFITEGRQHRCW